MKLRAEVRAMLTKEQNARPTRVDPGSPCDGTAAPGFEPPAG
jgi:hypothetical protein